MSAPSLERALVPAGWGYEPYPEHPWFGIYTEPRHKGMVTVDYKARGFRLGMSMHGPMNSEKKYAGRGWRDSLERDAIAYLYAAVNMPPADARAVAEANDFGGSDFP